MTNYPNATAFRRSLEDRLRTHALTTSIPLDRLRKEAAGQRLLARLDRNMPHGSWALKGGLALIARMNDKARATKDIDATWRIDALNLHDSIIDALEIDLDDFFEFLVAPPQPIRAEGPEGGLRFRISALLDGRMFEPLQLDINLVPGDPRPIESVATRNLFDFAGLPELRVPTVLLAQHLAEKLHAYCHSYGSEENSRAKDLYDMLTIVEQLRLPPAPQLVGGCKDTFSSETPNGPRQFQHHQRVGSPLGMAMSPTMECNGRRSMTPSLR